MTIGQFIPLLAFAISVALNRAMVAHAWCFCIAVAFPLASLYLLVGSHRPSGQEAFEVWLTLLVSASALAALGFLFRKRSSNSSNEDADA